MLQTTPLVWRVANSNNEFRRTKVIDMRTYQDENAAKVLSCKQSTEETADRDRAEASCNMVVHRTNTLPRRGSPRVLTEL